MSSIGVLIPTFQAAKHLPHCLPPLLSSPLKPRILLIDSSSSDDTVSIARAMGVEVIVIPKKEFNHGATRERGRRYLGTSVIVMMTQDAYASSFEMLSFLVKPLLEGKTSISYARQLPHENADVFASFSRFYNYPSESHVRSIKEMPTYGVYTFFCSNSCAAYLNHALDEVGGFPETMFGEDTIVAAKLIQAGHHIAYVSDAIVCHSHNYSLKEEFLRHKVMGQERRAFKDLFVIAGSENRRGSLYAKELLKFLSKRAPLKIPYAILHLLAKWLGYHWKF